MWLIIEYSPTALFSLKYSAATSTGAKSLLVPSPYTIKMAFLVAAIRWKGIEYALGFFEIIRDVSPMLIRPSKYAVANRCFLKYQKPREDKVAKSKRKDSYEAPIGYQSTVGFREYVYLHGNLSIAMQVDNEERGNDIVQLAARTNYFGKRGGFMQFVGFNYIETLPVGYSCELTQGLGISGGIIQPLDDMNSSLTFEKVDITNNSPLRSSDRPSTLTLIPYRSWLNSYRYASYIRIS